MMDARGRLDARGALHPQDGALKPVANMSLAT